MTRLIGLILIVAVLLSGCAYVASTKVTVKADKVDALAGKVPVGVQDGDVLVERYMMLYLGDQPKFGDDADIDEESETTDTN